MASIATKKSGSRLIRIVLPNGSRRGIGIGKCSMKAAQSCRHHIEHIESAASRGQAIPQAQAEWLRTCPRNIAERLAELELIEPFESQPEDKTVAGFFNETIDGRVVKDRTKVRYRNQAWFFLQFIGEGTALSRVPDNCGDGFIRHLKTCDQKRSPGKRLHNNTMAKAFKTAKQILDVAVTQKLMTTNPLQAVQKKAPRERVTDERVADITPEMIESLIAVSNREYALIYALARYGGLRCPSELDNLRWSEMNWADSRFLVHSPKTAYCGKATRMVPMFPELLPHLRYAFETASDGVDQVFPKVTEDSNLRTHTLRLLGRAAISENDVPRFFQNCRSSCQTDLGDSNLYSPKAISEFLGNS
ncbi:MAG: phage integrase SAM-like domain-containing protein, partial [Planctomycetaceae bacterium]